MCWKTSQNIVRQLHSGLRSVKAPWWGGMFDLCCCDSQRHRVGGNTHNPTDSQREDEQCSPRQSYTLQSPWTSLGLEGCDTIELDWAIQIRVCHHPTPPKLLLLGFFWPFFICKVCQNSDSMLLQDLYLLLTDMLREQSKPNIKDIWSPMYAWLERNG